MKYRRPLQMILLLIALSPMLLPAQETASPTSSMSAYGLEQGKSYSAETVLQLLDAFAQEGRAAVIDAYNQGYKAGAIDYAPNSAYWEAMSLAWKQEAKPGPTWGTVAIGTGAGVLVGFVLGVGAVLLLSVN